MSSLLTNSASMSALRQLSTTQRALQTTQGQVSSGLRVANASDNAAYWSIGVAMKSRVAALAAVNDGLDLADGLFKVSTAGLHTILGALNRIKQDVITAATPGTDLAQIQQDVASNQQVMKGAAAEATYNNLNILDNPTTSGFSAQEYETEVDGNFVSGTGTDNYGVVDVYGNDTESSDQYSFQQGQEANGTYSSVSGTPPYDTYADVDQPLTVSDAGLSVNPLDIVGINMNGILNGQGGGGPDTMPVYREINNTVHTTDPVTGMVDANVVKTQYETSEPLNPVRQAKYDFYTLGRQPVHPVADLHTTTGIEVGQSVPYFTTSNGSGIGSGYQSLGGSLVELYPDMDISDLDVTGFTQHNLDGSSSHEVMTLADFQNISTMVDNDIKFTTSAASIVASYSNLVEAQRTFNSALSDAITAGVGSLEDADMNLASTRLQALQTQQQLGIQSLSIANQNSQLVLKLFGTG